MTDTLTVLDRLQQRIFESSSEADQIRLRLGAVVSKCIMLTALPCGVVTGYTFPPPLPSPYARLHGRLMGGKALFYRAYQVAIRDPDSLLPFPHLLQ